MRTKLNTSLLLNLLVLAAFVLPAGAGSLQYQGLTNTSLGDATIATNCCVSNLGSSGQDGLALVITNLGSSGQDGVSIALPANLTALEVAWLSLDPSNTLPVGAYVQEQIVGTANGVTDGVLGTLTMTKQGTTNYVMSANFSPMGANAYIVQAYLQGVLVGQTAGQNGASVASMPVLPNFDLEKDINGAPMLTVHWPSATRVTAAGGASVTCDHLFITPQKVTLASAPTAMNITASQVPSITIVGENESLVYDGWANTSSGDASVAINCCVSNLGSGGQDGVGLTLVITNLGSSGQDGVSIALPTNLPAPDVTWLPLDDSNTLPAGAYLQGNFIGTGGSVTNGLLGSVTVTKAGTTNYAVTADYPSSATNTFTVSVYNGGSLVTTVAGLSNTLCVASEMMKDILPGTNLHTGGPNISWPPPHPPSFTFTGGQVVQGDSLTIVPSDLLNATPSISSVQLLASGIPSITIIGENQSLIYQGLTNTSSGNALENIACCVSNLGSGGQDGVGLTLIVTNLGSSGQDGVSITLPADSTGLNASYAPLDASNTLPAGAYVQEQVIGTANGVTNDVLGTVTVTKQGTTNYAMSADFSPMGASTCTVQAYLQGTLVAQATNQNGASLAAFGTMDLSAGLEITSGGLSWTMGWGNNPIAMDIYEPDTSLGTPSTLAVTCDQLIVTPQNVTVESAPAALNITASQIPAIIFVGENESLVYQGLTNTSLGIASESIACCVSNLGSGGQDGVGLTLIVTNLGSSGQDGVSISMPTDLSGLTVGWQNLDPSNTLPVGAYVQEQIIGTAGAVTNGVLGTVTVTKECATCGVSNYLVTADFSPMGMSSYTVAGDVNQDGRPDLVATNQNGAPLAEMGVMSLLGGLEISSSGLSWTLGWGNSPIAMDIYEPDTSLGTPSTLAVTCDQLVITPQNMPMGSTAAALQVTASQVPSITIIGAIDSLIYQGLTNSSLGYAVVSNGCCVSNLGSSGQDGVSLVVSNLGSGGQDGVSISIPTGLSALDVGWQNLDPSNMLPLGAYVQEQLVGTADGITNGAFGAVIVTKECAVCGGSNYLVSADFSPIGAKASTVQACLNGAVVAQGTYTSGASVADLAILPLTMGWGPTPPDGAPVVRGYYLDWKPAASVTLAGLASVTCDHLYISPANVSLPSAPTAVQIIVSQVPSLTINGMAISPWLISSSLNNQTATLQWYGSGTLQESTDLTTWTDITNAFSPYDVAAPQSGGPSKFYRLIFSP